MNEFRDLVDKIEGAGYQVGFCTYPHSLTFLGYAIDDATSIVVTTPNDNRSQVTKLLDLAVKLDANISVLVHKECS